MTFPSVETLTSSEFFKPAGNALELIFGLSNPYLILLLFPIGAYIICRSDAEDASYWQIQKIISLGIIILLVSSIFIFPFAASPYYPYAFATNSTGQNVTTSILGDIDGDGFTDLVEGEMPDKKQFDKAKIGDIDGDGVVDTVESIADSGEPSVIWEEFMSASSEPTDSSYSDQTTSAVGPPSDPTENGTATEATTSSPSMSPIRQGQNW